MFGCKERENFYRFIVAEKSLLAFARIVGMSHVRKKNNLLAYLRRGATYKIPILKKKSKKLQKVIGFLRPYKENVYIRLTKNREKVNKADINNKIRYIESVLGVKAVEVKRQRKNNHFYICSRALVREIKDHYHFVKAWTPLTNNKIKKLKESWKII